MKNLNTLARSSVETAPHDDTVVNYYEKLDTSYFEELPVEILRRLIRMKVLDRWRLHGKFLVAIDGTGQLFFRKRHCEHCLTKTLPDGTVLYFHHVLEAKLVTAGGLAFSMATEFIENTDPEATKQDCEIKAFYRLADKLKRNFPQLPIIILADALYNKGPVFDRCKEFKWNFIFTFKKGAIPELFDEYTRLKNMSRGNTVERENNDVNQTFSWVNNLKYQDHVLSALECIEVKKNTGEETRFVYLTDIKAGCSSVVTLANNGGRMRWKIENQGFKIQKVHGYEMEHAYSEDEKVSKMFYFLLQVAHAINQLMAAGSLIEDFNRIFGSLRNFFRRLAEAFRNSEFEENFWNSKNKIQIRFSNPPP